MIKGDTRSFDHASRGVGLVACFFGVSVYRIP